MKKNRPRGPQTEQQLVDWLLSRATKRGDCLICHLAEIKDGYSLVQANGKKYVAHRLVCEVTHELKEGEIATHTCHVACCINPDHLKPGTPRSNMQDKMRAGRWRNKWV